MTCACMYYATPHTRLRNWLAMKEEQSLAYTFVIIKRRERAQFTHSLIGRRRSQCLLLIEPLDRRLKMIRYDKLSWWPEYAKVDSCQLEDTDLPQEKENTSFFLFKVRKQIVVLMLYMSGGGTDTIKKYWTASRAAEATAKPRCDSATPSTMPMHGQKAMRKLACHTMLRRLLLQPTLLLVS